MVRIVSGAWQENCYVVSSRATSTAVVIDPGSSADRIWEAVAEQRATVKAILLTHAHYDHVDGVAALTARCDAPVYLHRADAPLLRGVNAYAMACKLPMIKIIPPDVLLDGGEVLNFDDLRISVLHLPGHSPGGVAFEIGSMLFVGDTILRKVTGRTDLPGGDPEAMAGSLTLALSRISAQTLICPGHGSPLHRDALLQDNAAARESARQ